MELFRRCLSSDARRDADQRRGEERSELVEIGGYVDLSSDEFEDAAALGFHLTNTASDHFPSLLSIATTGPFLFFGEVPAEMKQATEQMQLGAEFSTHMAGFDR